LNGAKEKLGWPLEPRFYIPADVLAHFRQAIDQGQAAQQAWLARFETYRALYPQEAAGLERRIDGSLPVDWEKSLPVFPADPKGMATRAASGKVINAIAAILPELVGGSADLAPSNNTWIQGEPAFQADCPGGRNFHFGVREHGMGAIVNGMAVHGGLIPYAATFLTFSDYMRGALRLSAFSHIPSIWIYTHDSIGLGEDGPTHQPVEQLLSLRAIPNLVTLRPADANETAEAWKVAIRRRSGPTVLALTRQALPVFDRSVVAPAAGLERGAYVLADLPVGKTPRIILMASGSEVSLTLAAGQALAESGVAVRVVSFPSWELFARQDQSYRDSVLLPGVKARLAVEAGIGIGWERWVGDAGEIIAMQGFGASAPAKVLFEKFGFTVENVLARARKLLAD
jgi:transketolase